MLTENDPRHVANRGKGGAAPAGDRFKIVNVIDAGDMLERALGTRVGERVLVNHIRANAGAFNAALNRG